MNITIVAGARPNFMKISPIIKAIQFATNEGKKINFRLVHTGQHYDKLMSEQFFNQLGIPAPDSNLECGGGSQAEQTAAIMIKFEKELLLFTPQLVIVVGDVTSTMACTLTAKKMGIDVAHVEAGIRSGDMTMPEEINRIVTDSICDYYFTTSKSANNNLLTYNVPVEKIFFVGNTMIDTLLYNLHKIKRPYFLDEYQIKAKEFILLTLHRPSNVDNPDKLKGILEAVMSSAENNKIIFPVHPRTKLILEKLNFSNKNILMIDPQGYLEFIYLVKNTKAIVTDSGGITEEATVLNIPCLTMRNSTERPETVSFGTNELIGDDIGKLKSSLKLIINNQWKTGTIPPLWDGKTSERIVNIVYSLYEMNTKSTAVLN